MHRGRRARYRDRRVGRRRQGTRGSVVTVGAEEFPPVLNMITPEGNGQWTGDDRGARACARLQAAARLLVRAVALRQGLHGSSNSPFTVDCTIRREAKWSDGVADHRRRLQVHVRHDHEPEEQRRHAQRLRQDPDVQRRQPHRVPDGLRRDLRAVPRAVGEHEHAWCCRSTCSRDELQQGLEHLHLRPEDEEADRQRPDARAVVQTGPADHARPEPQLLGEQGHGLEGRVHPDHSTATRGQRVPRRRGRHDLPAEPDRFAQADRSGRRREVHVVARPAVGALRHAHRRCPVSTTSRSARRSPPRCRASRSSIGS